MRKFTKKQFIAEVIETLRELEDFTSENRKEKGICSLLLSYNFDFPKDLFKNWGEFSGSDLFPVPFEGRDPASVFWREPKWGESEYGDSRRRLCEYIIDELESMKIYEN